LRHLNEIVGTAWKRKLDIIAG